MRVAVLSFLQSLLLSRAVCGASSGAKRLGMAGGSASKRRALADLGNTFPHPLGQREGGKVSTGRRPLPPTPLTSSLFFAIQSCAPPQVGPFPLTSTIWSGGVAPTAQPVSLMQPREACLWGECSPPPPLCTRQPTPPPCRDGVPAPVPFPRGRGGVHCTC